jgi:hypothetical protein
MKFVMHNRNAARGDGEMGQGDMRPAPQAAARVFIERRAIDPSQNDEQRCG